MADNVAPFPTQRQPGLDRTVSNAEIMAAERRQMEEQRASQADTLSYIGLAGYIRQQWDMMCQHRNTVNGWSDRLLSSLRCIQGQYEPQKLAEIRRFGGSEVYARLIAAKIRGAQSLLRDVYLGADKAWGLRGPDDPTIPTEQLQSIEQLVTAEVQSAAMGAPAVPDPTGMGPGQPATPGEMPTPDKVQRR